MSLTDLPTEVLELIYADLDPRTLYSVSQLSQHLHYTALPRLFQKVDLYEDILKDGFLTLTATRPSTTADAVASRHTILGAIRSALFLDKISTYNLGLASNIEDALIDMREVTRILETTKHCKKLEVSFEALGKSMAGTTRTTGKSTSQKGQTGKIYVEEWRDVLLGLLEEALKSGCKDLRIMNGGLLSGVYCGPKGTPITLTDLAASSDMKALGPLAAKKSKWNWFTRFFTLKIRHPNKLGSNLALPRRMVGRSAIHLRPLSNISQTQLTYCFFRQHLLLQPPFRTWTIHILNNSPHLTSLIFLSQPLKPADWSRLLGSITCPSLTELRLKSVNISFKDLSAFLRRHSAKLRVLELTAGDGYLNVDQRTLEVDSMRSVIPKRAPNSRVANEEDFIAPMPMLEELSAIPIYFVWLMNQTLTVPTPPPSSSFHPYTLAIPNTTPTDQQSLDVRFPRLKELTIYADNFKRTLGRDFAYLERVFQVLGLYIGSFKGNESQSPLRGLTLQSFNDPASLKPFFKLHQADVSRQLGRSSPHKGAASVIGRPISYRDSCTLSESTSTSITPPLIGIRTVRLRVNRYPAFVEELIAFVKGFPDVEVLEVLGLQADNLKSLLRFRGGMVVDNSKWKVRILEECVDFLG